MTGYELTRTWFDWAFENPDLNTPTHTATYMWIIEKWNRSGHAKKIVLPSSESMTAIGVKSYNTYIKVLNELIEFGFIEMIQKSKNQFTANIIAISNFNKALDKALDKAMIKHSTKQSESTDESIDSIYKQDNKETRKQDTEEEKEKPTADDDTPDFVKANRDAVKPKKEITKEELKADLLENEYCRRSANQNGIKANYELFVNDFIFEKFGLGENTKWKDLSDARSHFSRWVPYHKNSNTVTTSNNGRKQQSNVIL